jgi:hypothetical protein
MVEVNRMVADWLAGTTLDSGGASQSVATHLASMTFDGSDTAPALTGGVIDETRDGSAARHDEPTTKPALEVSVQEWEVETATMVTTEQRGTCRVLIRYLADDTTSQHAVRDAYYVMRAVRRSLERLHLPAEANAGRVRNSVAIIPSSAEPMRMVKVEAQREDGGVSSAWMVPYRVWELDV